MLTLAITFFYMSNMSFNIFVSDLLQTKFQISSVEAGSYFGSVYFIAAIMLPVLGYVVDKFG